MERQGLDCIDSINYIESKFLSKEGVEMYLSVGPAGKLSTTWGRLKSAL